MTASHCANCENELSPTQYFCAFCGQKAQLHRLSWHDITHDAIHYFTHADKGIFHLLVQLLTKTGTVAREFVGGKRKKYFPPFNFFLVVAAIYVFISAFNAKSSTSTSDVLSQHPELQKITDTKKREQLIHIYERSSRAMQFMARHSNSVAMLALPLIAFICWLFYRRNGYNYIEHLVANMYMAGFALLCQVLVFIPIGKLLLPGKSNVVLFIFFVFQLIYFSVFYYHFINRRGWAGGTKAFLVSLFAIAFWVMLSGGLIRLYITNGFWGLLP